MEMRRQMIVRIDRDDDLADGVESAHAVPLDAPEYSPKIG
jgi:hypothetical protein